MVPGDRGWACGLRCRTGARPRTKAKHVFWSFRSSVRLILLPVILGLAAAVATAGSLLSLRKVMRLDPAPALRGE